MNDDLSGDKGSEEPDLEVLEESALARAQATIWKAMRQADISKADMARGMARPRSFISRMLSGEHNLTIKTMARALLACGYEVEFGLSPIAWHWAHQDCVRTVNAGGVPDEGTPLTTNVFDSWSEECPLVGLGASSVESAAR